MNDAATVQVDHAPQSARGIGPRWVPGALIVVATVLALLSAIITWANDQALDTDEWVDTADELLADETIRSATANYLVDQLYENVDVGAAIGERLPENLSGLGDPIAGALRSQLDNVAERLLESQQVRRAWALANRQTHEVLVAILLEETRDAVSVEGGEVVLNLGDVLVSLGQNIGIPDSVLDRVPDDAGQVVLLESDELDSLQTAAQASELLSWFVFLVVVVLYVLAVFLARGRRMHTLGRVGLSLLIAGIVLLLVRVISINTSIDLLVDDPTQRPVARAIADIFTDKLTEMAWAGVIYGILIMLFAALLGDHRWAVATRRFIAPAFRLPVAAIVAGTALVYLLLWWWSPGNAFERWVTALTLLGLLIGAAVVLTLQLREEFPGDDVSPDDASPDDVSPDDASPTDRSPDDASPDDLGEPGAPTAGEADTLTAG